MKIAGLAAALALASLGTAAPARDDATPRFAPEAMRDHVTYLADDRLEGRHPGTPGYDLAADYVVKQFEALGLRPAGTGGGWLQQVPLRTSRLVARGQVVIGRSAFVGGRDVAIKPSVLEEEQSVEAPAVFAGFGIDMPQKGFDDYAGLDVRGKFVAVLSGFPKGTPNDLGAHLNAEKARMALKRGAIGIITIRTRALDKRRPLAWTLRLDSGRPTMTWMKPDGSPFAGTEDVRVAAMLGQDAAEALFAGAPRTLASILGEADRQGGKPGGFALTQPVKIERNSRFQQVSSPNILAMLPGSDPSLAGEYVIVSAHLDHDGIKAGATGDNIVNGAIDNAAGVATMLEVARAMAQAPVKPRRPVVFAAVTAEEFGLLGSEYLAKYPTVANAKPVAVVNFNSPVLFHDFTDLVAFGAEHSTLGRTVAKAASSARIALSPDTAPEEAIFTRSDHYSFVKEGVPSVFLMTGSANGGGKAISDYFSRHYHQPSDQIDLPFDWKAAAKFAMVNYRITTAIANEPAAPRWYADSFFGNTFAQGRERAGRAGK